jgi:hypothetical protein
VVTARDTPWVSDTGGRDFFPRGSDMTRLLMQALSEHPFDMADLVADLYCPVLDDDTLLDLMLRVSGQAVRLLPGVVWAGVTAQFDDQPLTIAHTDQRVLVLDETQYGHRAGPCLDAIRLDEPVAADLDAAHRLWPAVGLAAARTGIRGILAVPLRVERTPVGALNLYCSDEVGLRNVNADVLLVLTEYLENGLREYVGSRPDSTRLVRLRVLLENRNTVGLAVGVLAVVRGIEPHDAQSWLTQDAWHKGISLIDAARLTIEANQFGPATPPNAPPDWD